MNKPSSKVSKDKRNYGDDVSIQALSEVQQLHYKLFLLENLLQSECHGKEKTTHRTRIQQLNDIGKNIDIRASLNALVQAYDSALESKIVTKTQHLRSPVDMLENGCLGPEIAHLLSTIRVYHVELKSYCNS